MDLASRDATAQEVLEERLLADVEGRGRTDTWGTRADEVRPPRVLTRRGMKKIQNSTLSSGAWEWPGMPGSLSRSASAPGGKLARTLPGGACSSQASAAPSWNALRSVSPPAPLNLGGSSDPRVGYPTLEMSRAMGATQQACPHCGNFFMPDAVYCRKCGATRPTGWIEAEGLEPRDKYFRQRGFGISKRPSIHPDPDHEVGPGQYDKELQFGNMMWRKEALSHPAQQTLSSHKAPVLCTFPKPRVPVAQLAQTPFSQQPGPGHYCLPDLWDSHWQRFPATGKTFAKKGPQQGESRFGGLARSLVKGSGGGGEEFLGS